MLSTQRLYATERSESVSESPGKPQRAPNISHVSKELHYGQDSGGGVGAPPPLTLRLFGPIELLLHGRPLPRLRSRKEPWLLALLTLHAGQELDRGWLAALLWPDCSEAATWANL